MSNPSTESRLGEQSASDGDDSEGGRARGSARGPDSADERDDHENEPPTPPGGGRSAAPSGARLSWLLSGLVGLALGAGAGLLVGKQLWRRPPAARSECPPAASASAVVPGAAAAPTALAVAVGTLATQATLEGTWNPRVHMDGRDVATTTGKTARIVVPTPPPGKGVVLGVVAKAAGIKLTEQLEVVVAAEDKLLAKWALPTSWSLLAAPLPPSAGPLTLDFSLPGWTAPADQDAPSPALAIDELQIGVLTEAARIDLRTHEGRAGLLQGFYAVEGPGCEEPWAWSEGLRSTLGLLLDPVSGGYKLRLHAAALDALAPLSVDVRINDKHVGQLDVAGLGEHDLDVPDGMLTTGANVVELRYPRSASPADVAAGATDTRDLAIRFYAASLTPTSR